MLETLVNNALSGESLNADLKNRPEVAFFLQNYMLVISVVEQSKSEKFEQIQQS